MKNFRILVSLMLVLICVLLIQNKLNAKEETPDDIEGWTFLQIGITPAFPGVIDYSNVYGLKLGLPMTSGYGKVSGLELSLFASGTNYIYGVQMSPVNITKKIYGWQLGFTNVARDDAYGIQMAAVNVTSETAGGVQMGVVNYAGSANGLQLGLVNVADKQGLQLGLINIIADGWLPFSILFNVSF